MNILKGFDFSNFESPDFKQDSVREEIVQPILTALGYKASGKLKIVRSRKFIDPYVQIGSQKEQTKIFYPVKMLIKLATTQFITRLE